MNFSEVMKAAEVRSKKRIDSILLESFWYDNDCNTKPFEKMSKDDIKFRLKMGRLSEERQILLKFALECSPEEWKKFKIICRLRGL